MQIQKAKGREDFGKSEKLRVQRGKGSIKRRGQRTRNGTGTTEPDVGRLPLQGPKDLSTVGLPVGLSAVRGPWLGEEVNLLSSLISPP